ncbi:hypothetical protein DHW03_15535 [Pedobacter yonginense]|uniref:Lipid/polyisoprenoid-binding YceI-like domain-containing protein n=1 Tax=Pedobacter yonginense TaxID=651869 RepID=A0A317EHZ1_9SPHI|nr:YceI family protein [Pedobacter yonginense]PWS26204.1 hypothetical protein DHW03_15535 [Pedobacter yonginense]
MTTVWKVDPSHSEVQFKVKHLMITTITGNFGTYDLEVETEGDDFTKSSMISFSATVDSISTNNEQRDGHLKSEEFFDAKRYPAILFEGHKFENKGEDYSVTGDLTIKGVTKPITVDVEYGGIAVDPYGQTKAGFSLSGKIRRKLFGLTWEGITEAGNIVVSDEIKFIAEVQLIKQN